jgi:hypothetical protein
MEEDVTGSQGPQQTVAPEEEEEEEEEEKEEEELEKRREESEIYYNNRNVFYSSKTRIRFSTLLTNNSPTVLVTFCINMANQVLSTSYTSCIVLDGVEISQKINKSPAFYGTRKFVPVFRKHSHWAENRATKISSIYSIQDHF